MIVSTVIVYTLYNIIHEFEFSKKFISPIKMCINRIRYLVRVENISKEFEVMTGLIQGDAFSPSLFNIAFEKVISNDKK